MSYASEKIHKFVQSLPVGTEFDYRDIDGLMPNNNFTRMAFANALRTCPWCEVKNPCRRPNQPTVYIRTSNFMCPICGTNVYHEFQDRFFCVHCRKPITIIIGEKK